VKVIVNDANILIDLVDLKILPYFFQLKFEFYTTAIILEELFDEQQEALLPYIETGRLIVDNITEEDLIEILMIRATKSNLSVQDCSAFYQARKNKADLITSDNTLRKFAQVNNIEVHGHLWVFDNLVNNEILTGNTAIKKLEELCNVLNPKVGLTKNECQKRIKLWSLRNNKL
jgi:predicted nucleic acid-binding protein